ncbi:hypothetical protein [Paenibacillus sp. 1P03SA]|uniref:XkdQ/YqbQ family protein n=1 Tax=Paenibacillus sp. 1P03SA TaxID=3132294 RepID=UPI0039A319AE
MVDDIVKSVTWSGDTKQASRKLEVQLSNTLDGRTRALDIQLGAEIRFYSDSEELFRGIIFSHKIDSSGQMSLTAYDENIYLAKNKDSKKFVKKTASAIIKSLCSEFGIPTGVVEDTGYIIPKLILRDKTLWEIMVTALTVTYHQTGRKYFIYAREGKLNLSARKDVVAKINLETGLNIVDASFSASIEEMRTQVKVVGELKGKDSKGKETKTEISASAKNDALIKRFGVMQHLESMSGDVTRSQIEQRAKELLKQLAVITDQSTLNCLGVDDVVSGGAVYAYEPLTGIQGSYYVSADSHSWQSGNHTMSITITATDDLPLMEYEPPDEEKPEKKSSKKSAEKKKKKSKGTKKKKPDAAEIKVNSILNARGT